MSALTKTTVLLERDGTDSTFGGYTSFSAEGAGVGVLWLERQVWADMGSPDEITVTVVPGDTLNGDA